MRWTEKVDTWFAHMLDQATPPVYESCGLHAIRLGLLTTGAVRPQMARSLADLAHAIVGSGGTLVLPETSSLLTTPDFRDRVLTTSTVAPTLAYGQTATSPGLHVMETPTEHWVGNVDGLGCNGG